VTALHTMTTTQTTTQTTAVVDDNYNQARELTDKIKVALSICWDLVQEAYQGRCWEVLGYPSWDAYCETEFNTSRLRLPREDRPEVVRSLREAGLSVRAIASATGESKSTIGRELSTVPNGTVETIIGTNGKAYQVVHDDVVREITSETLVFKPGELFAQNAHRVVLGLTDDEWSDRLAQARATCEAEEADPAYWEAASIMAAAGDEQFEDALDRCRGEGDLSLENVLSKLRVAS